MRNSMYISNTSKEIDTEIKTKNSIKRIPEEKSFRMKVEWYLKVKEYANNWMFSTKVLASNTKNHDKSPEITNSSLVVHY